MTRSRAYLAAAASAGGLFFLYFFGLTRTGIIGPDEPRYAAIGRTMAATGDWITPRLWGHPWFEKPALLYWMTASGFKLGLGPDWGPRLPVALASVAFLVYFFFALRREFGDRVAWYGSAILASSIGWFVYSHVAITDLPMSAAFAAAMLAILNPPARPRSFLFAGVCLGLAILAKGLVPLVLFIPALWFLRRRIPDLAILFCVAAVVAAPWYLLVTLRNGTAFLDEFFIKQHFGRFLTNALQHERPVWFYVPVLLAGILPWTPLLLLVFNRQLYRDARTRFLLAWFAWGFVFFSASRNKLPGYLLPLLPALAVLMSIALVKSTRPWPLLAPSAVLLCLIPAFAGAIPAALAEGVSRASLHINLIWIAPALLLAIASMFLDKSGKRDWAVALLVVCASASVLGVLWRISPVLDRDVSGRAFWKAQGPSVTCLPPMARSPQYSVYYYAGRRLPDCR
jgi:4-amino-4-deoxy-L-arabinose transferase